MVSPERSAENRWPFISTTVRQQPLTAMLLEMARAGATPGAWIVTRPPSLCSVSDSIVPKCSMIPVNMIGLCAAISCFAAPFCADFRRVGKPESQRRKLFRETQKVGIASYAMAMNARIRSFLLTMDRLIAGVPLALGSEDGVLLSFLFHSLYQGTDEPRSRDGPAAGNYRRDVPAFRRSLSAAWVYIRVASRPGARVAAGRQVCAGDFRRRLLQQRSRAAGAERI